jgi:hypothetical protein
MFSKQLAVNRPHTGGRDVEMPANQICPVPILAGRPTGRQDRNLITRQNVRKKHGFQALAADRIA